MHVMIELDDEGRFVDVGLYSAPEAAQRAAERETDTWTDDWKQFTSGWCRRAYEHGVYHIYAIEVQS